MIDLEVSVDFEPSDISIETDFSSNIIDEDLGGGGGGGGVTSVNGKTGVVVLDADDIGYDDSTVGAAISGKADVITESAGPASVVSFAACAGGRPLKSLTVASGATALTKCGKNMLDSDGLINGNVFTKSGSAYVFTKVGTGIANRSSADAPVFLETGKTYTISFKCTDISEDLSNCNIRAKNSGGTYSAFLQSAEWDSSIAATFTPEFDVVAIQFYFGSGSAGVGGSVTISEIQIEPGGIVSDFEAYKEETYTLTDGVPDREVTTYAGGNSMWTDSGDISAEVYADTKLYIQTAVTDALGDIESALAALR